MRAADEQSHACLGRDIMKSFGGFSLSGLLAFAWLGILRRQRRSATRPAAAQALPQVEVTTVKSQKLNAAERLPAELIAV